MSTPLPHWDEWARDEAKALLAMGITPEEVEYMQGYPNPYTIREQEMIVAHMRAISASA